ncbi:hypothetical protein D0U04_26455 [Bacillus clarus]|uniref:Lipoprotein n=1 Tax=Bacillus clarus TaxID=2338372 RepID=A0A090Y9X9_9BACI|nr:hypothetical protein [Bacillus clarus]KFM95001.1 hypothetical protein DJ93_5667 [Bacillus clarus]RFT62956.1 hypothetical protein D0U04_26455 [Bacillus clarus]
MKKIILGALTSFFLLSGCNNSTESKPVDTKKNTTEETTNSTKNKDTKDTNSEKTEEVLSPTNQSTKDFITPLLVKSETPADIMTIQIQEDMKQKLEEITKKTQASLQKNYAWYKEYLTTVQPGERLPYHENMGITQEEYELFISSDQYMKLVKGQEGNIHFKKVNDNVYEIETSSQIKLLNKVQIDFANNTLKTEFGTLNYDDKVEASDGQKITGRWNGEQWRLSTGSFTAKYAIGQLEDSKKTIIYITAKGLLDGKAINQEQVIEFKAE